MKFKIIILFIFNVYSVEINVFLNFFYNSNYNKKIIGVDIGSSHTSFEVFEILENNNLNSLIFKICQGLY